MNPKKIKITDVTDRIIFFASPTERKRTCLSINHFPGARVGQIWKLYYRGNVFSHAKRVDNWKYVLPATLLVVGAALIIYRVSLPTERAALYTPSVAELTAVAGVFYQVEPDADTDRWVDYGDPAIYEAGGLTYITPPAGVQPGQIEIEGKVFPNYACYLDAECREDWIRVAERDTWDSDPRYKLIATFSVPTETPVPTITPTATPTLTPEPLEDCFKVVWDKGIAAQGLNMRTGPDMSDNADGRSYLGPGFIFKPLAFIETSQGWFAKVAEPNWWIATDLIYNDNVYTVRVGCE
ncbi:MAG TPA: hypothetical protein VMW24_09080 [Sedimentisphaerales bacterium]|nr:hypothetical protein [Sedimentisphaerales bacterium]